MRRDPYATTGSLARHAPTRVARLVHRAVLVTFLSAAVCTLLAGVGQSAGHPDLSATLAALGYVLGVVGFFAGVVGLVLEPPSDRDTH
jgi:hypothetical protein